MKYKTQREQDDFGQLAVHNLSLKRVLVMLDNFCVLEFKQEIEVTSIYRTEEENKACNAATEIHVLWRAADVSIKSFSLDQQAKIVNFTNMLTYPGTPGHKVGLIHAVPGGVSHLHLQYF